MKNIINTRSKYIIVIGLFALVYFFLNAWKPVHELDIDSCFGQFDMAARGDYVYNICRNRLDIITFVGSNDDLPIIAGEYRSGEILHSVEIYENFVIMTSVKHGIEVLDISDPISPKRVDLFPRDKKARYSHLLIGGDLAFVYNTWSRDVINLGNSIDILDISNPSNIQKVSRIYNVGKPMAIVGSYLYTNRGLDENGINDYLMSIIDFSDVEKPIVVDILDEFGWVYDAVVRDDLMFLGTDRNLIITDISDPLAPIEIGRANQYMEEILLAGDLIYFWTFPKVGAYNISDPTLPFKVASYGNINVNAIAIMNNFVFYGGHFGHYVHVFPTLGD